MDELPRALSQQVWGMRLAELCFGLDFGWVLLGPCFDLLGFSSFDKWVLFGCTGLMVCISELPSGICADYMGRKFTLAMGFLCQMFGSLLVCYCLLTLPLPSASNIELNHWYTNLALPIGMLLRGGAESLRSGSGEAFIDDHLRLHKCPEMFLRVWGGCGIYWKV